MGNEKHEKSPPPRPLSPAAQAAWRYVEILKQIKAAPHVIAAAEREARRLEEEQSRPRVKFG